MVYYVSWPDINIVLIINLIFLCFQWYVGGNAALMGQNIASAFQMLRLVQY